RGPAERRQPRRRARCPRRGGRRRSVWFPARPDARGIPSPPACWSDLDDLAAVVRAADAAGGVRQFRRPALRAGDGGDGGGLPLRPAGPGVAARHPALPNGHDWLPFLLGVVDELGELRPARVGPGVAVVSRQLVPGYPALGAQPWAVLPAQR